MSAHVYVIRDPLIPQFEHDNLEQQLLANYKEHTITAEKNVMLLNTLLDVIKHCKRHPGLDTNHIVKTIQAKLRSYEKLDAKPS